MTHKKALITPNLPPTATTGGELAQLKRSAPTMTNGLVIMGLIEEIEALERAMALNEEVWKKNVKELREEIDHQ